MVDFLSKKYSGSTWTQELLVPAEKLTVSSSPIIGILYVSSLSHSLNSFIVCSCLAYQFILQTRRLGIGLTHNGGNCTLRSQISNYKITKDFSNLVKHLALVKGLEVTPTLK